jgi:cation/acetate symporter
MTRIARWRGALLFFACNALTALPAAAADTAAPARSHNPIAIGMFLLFVASTLFITRWAARKNNSVSERLGDCRRLHVRRVAARDLCPRLHKRL